MGYFDPTSIERNGAIHSALRTRRFRQFVAGGRFWQRLGISKRQAWDSSSIARYIEQSKVLEIAHVASFAFLSLITAYFVLDHYWIGVAVLVIVNVLANLYPILVTRFNRHLLQRRLHREKRGSDDANSRAT